MKPYPDSNGINILVHIQHNRYDANAEKKVYKGYLEKYGFLSAHSCLATKLIVCVCCAVIL